MGRLISRDYVCKECDHRDTLMINTDEDHWIPRICSVCGGEALHSLNCTVSTSKTSKAIPDVVAKNRFSDIKEKRAFDREAKAARRRGATNEAKEIKQEAAKAGHIIKG